MNPCSVLNGYLAGLRKAIDFEQPLNEFGLPMQEQLEEDALAFPVSRITEHLRGFYCVLQSALGLYTLNKYFLNEVDEPPTAIRSTQGLNAVVQWVTTIQDGILGASMEYSLSRGVSAEADLGMNQVVYHNRERVLSLCRYLLLEARLLRRSLRNPNLSLRHVGYCYARFSVELNPAINEAHQRAVYIAEQVEERHGKRTRRRRAS